MVGCWLCCTNLKPRHTIMNIYYHCEILPFYFRLGIILETEYMKFEKEFSRWYFYSLQQGWDRIPSLAEQLVSWKTKNKQNNWYIITTKIKPKFSHILTIFKTNPTMIAISCVKLYSKIVLRSRQGVYQGSASAPIHLLQRKDRRLYFKPVFFKQRKHACAAEVITGILLFKFTHVKMKNPVDWGAQEKSKSSWWS